jgi:hypothetical protein
MSGSNGFVRSNFRSDFKLPPHCPPPYWRSTLVCEARDSILGFIQLYRIEFNQLVEVCRSAGALKVGLSTTFAQQSINDRGLRILLDHPKELWRFLKSDRYNGDPIELASAMAGVLEGLKPRSSLDYFLAKKNLRNFRGVHFAAMLEREDRILRSKKRLRALTVDSGSAATKPA